MNKKLGESRQLWDSPVFIDCDRSFIICSSLKEAEFYFQSRDIDDPAIIYDSAGMVWQRVFDGQRIRLVFAADLAAQNPPLASKIREYLEVLKAMGHWRCGDEWLSRASLDSLVREAARIEAEARLQQHRKRWAAGLLAVAAVAIAALTWSVAH